MIFPSKIGESISSILKTSPILSDQGEEIGFSREGRAIKAFKFGSGEINISLIGGCHADEPVGPRLLRHFVNYLGTIASQDPLLTQFSWWIVPHINPDGEVRNKGWYSDQDKEYDIVRYLSQTVRELPGDDIEFGFPKNDGDHASRPENRAVYNWWKQRTSPFNLHVSLHGMAFGAGPWFLIEKDWWNRCDKLQINCKRKATELGYVLHDVERNGEKGFYRLAKGFCSRPDSQEMRKYFLNRGDTETADKFRPSSMETIRSMGGDPLTLVSEMPLFIARKKTSEKPKNSEWKSKIHGWRAQSNKNELISWAKNEFLKPMPIKDQMILQWTFIISGLMLVSEFGQ